MITAFQALHECGAAGDVGLRGAVDALGPRQSRLLPFASRPPPSTTRRVGGAVTGISALSQI